MSETWRTYRVGPGEGGWNRPATTSAPMMATNTAGGEECFASTCTASQ